MAQRIALTNCYVQWVVRMCESDPVSSAQFEKIQKQNCQASEKGRMLT